MYELKFVDTQVFAVVAYRTEAEADEGKGHIVATFGDGNGAGKGYAKGNADIIRDDYNDSDDWFGAITTVNYIRNIERIS